MYVWLACHFFLQQDETINQAALKNRVTFFFASLFLKFSAGGDFLAYVP